MEYYIETPSNKGKADWLISNTKAEERSSALKGSSTHIPVVVVVVDNGIFEAAAIAYDKQELDAFCLVTDTRKKRFLLVPVEEIIKLQPRVKDKLNWT